MTAFMIIGGFLMAFAVWKFIGSVWKNDLEANDSAPGDGGVG